MKNNIAPPTKWERRVIKVMVLLGLFSIINFLFFFFDPDRRGNVWLFILLSITIIYGAIKKLYMWYNYSNISIPKAPAETPDLKVDILTTYFPGEPYQMIVTTLEAISKITYPHTAYLCDEANDPFLKKFCAENGIIHVTRDNRENAKAGNINNALQKVATGDICVVLDPDHIPDPDFLDPILPYFADPKIGFVQIVQSYYNIKDTLVARGAAEQTFQFYGPMMMTLNSYGTVNAIGANCVFRRKALDSIGGHAPGLCEDMHTAMLLYSKEWKAVYLPEVLAKGLAPSNLTTYFKQQLKWARGTFDLLVKVYPKVFSKLSTRQKIHFGILPLHYLCGLIYLINFLIPILALTFSTTPWRGNVIDFLFAVLPIAGSAWLIRTFVQKWVIEKEERGFHVMGGLLQINTWWIYLIGLFYTIINKKVPYLPTPKQSEFDTNLKIIIPNAAVALASVIAIVYGLSQDFTPFSLIMAGFAFFNTLIMLFGIYLTVRVTNQNRILRSNLQKKNIVRLWRIRSMLRESYHSAFSFTRKAAMPLLLLIIIFSVGFKGHETADRWKNVEPYYFRKASENYLGIFHPSKDDGLVDLEEVNTIEARKNLNFDIISFYLAWNRESIEKFPANLLHQISDKNAIPMITWEPWISELSGSPEHTFRRIADGEFDQYIREFAAQLAEYEKPVFLRFAHEFDNPQYPWHISEENTANDFKRAWRHVHDLIVEEGAKEVMMVWNPWKPEELQQYYPGDNFVDWVGITLLNYGPLNPNGEEYPFSQLYRPFHENIWAFTRKPVMLSEFGSVNFAGQQKEWLQNAMHSIVSDFSEIHAVVLFDSAYDKNIPKNDWYDEKYINWSVDSIEIISRIFDHSPTIENFNLSPLKKKFARKRLSKDPIKGVYYRKGEDWRNNYYVLTKETLIRDFKRMKDAGLNSIYYNGGNIYDFNVLKYATEFDLKVVYRFDLEPTSGFLEEKKTGELKREILKKVRDLKDNPAVSGFAFNLDLKPFFEKPVIFDQTEALLRWLQPILLEIKQIDPTKAVVVELGVDGQIKTIVRALEEALPIDIYNFRVNDHIDKAQLVTLSQELEVPFLISGIQPEWLENERDKTSFKNVIFENWQDERTSYRLSFDGLIDFKGRPKEKLNSLLENEEKPGNSLPVVRILKPAVPLLPGEKIVFHAMIYFNGSWIAAEDLEEPLQLEWSLVKNDVFGRHLALKVLGYGPQQSIEVPKNYKNYELLLSIIHPETGMVRQVTSLLHTPYQP